MLCWNWLKEDTIHRTEVCFVCCLGCSQGSWDSVVKVRIWHVVIAASL